MKAQDLVGKNAIRRKVVILSEEIKLMDPSYMDPNKPVYIKDYNYIDNIISIVTYDGIETALSGEYNDDKWVEVAKGSKIDNINVPVGYRSILDVYKAIDEKRYKEKVVKGDVLSDNIISIDECIDAIKAVLYEEESVLIKYSSSAGDTKIIAIEPDENERYHLYYCDGVGNYDVSFANDSFYNGIEKLMDNGITIIQNLNAIDAANTSLFGYDAINRMANLYDPEDDGPLIFITGSDEIYRLKIDKSRKLSIRTATPIDFMAMTVYGCDVGMCTIMLTPEESDDIRMKIESHDPYMCEKIHLD